LDEANRSLADARDKIDRQNQQMSEYEAELNLLRRRAESWDTEREKDKRQIAMLQDALNRARIVSR
jgi:intermediate filament protein if